MNKTEKLHKDIKVSKGRRWFIYNGIRIETTVSVR